MLDIVGYLYWFKVLIQKNNRVCFKLQARSWRKVMQLNMELIEVRRQTDQSFISLLQAVRVGR